MGKEIEKDLLGVIEDALKGKKFVVFKVVINFKATKQYKAYTNELLSLTRLPIKGKQIESFTIEPLEGIFERMERSYNGEWESESYTLYLRVNEILHPFSLYNMNEKLTFLE